MAVAAILSTAEVGARADGQRRVATTTWVPGLGRLVVAAAADLHVTPSLVASYAFAQTVSTTHVACVATATMEESHVALHAALPPPAAIVALV